MNKITVFWTTLIWPSNPNRLGYTHLNNRHLSHSSHIEHVAIVTKSVNHRSNIKLHTRFIPSEPTAPNRCK